jgi:hypothetical protein
MEPYQVITTVSLAAFVAICFGMILYGKWGD